MYYINVLWNNVIYIYNTYKFIKYNNIAEYDFLNNPDLQIKNLQNKPELKLGCWFYV